MFSLAYLAVWLTKIGSSSRKPVKILVFLQRQIYILFTVNLQFISLTQLALHDIGRERQGRYIFSYALSWLVTSVIIIEFIRAWLIVSQEKLTVEELSKKSYEEGLIKAYWTRHLDE